MKSLERLEIMRDELVEAYNKLLNDKTTIYDESTYVYAKYCADKAIKAVKMRALDLLTEETEKLEIKNENLQIDDK